MNLAFSRSAVRALSALVFFIFASFFSVQAQSQDSQIRWQARPEIAAYSGRPLAWDDLARLSLLVSGVDPSNVESYVTRLHTLADQAKQRTAGMNQQDLADTLLQFLHSGTFKAYRFDQTRVDVALDSGIFNCVSSALVYFVIGEYLGLQMGAIETTDHAFCTVNIDGRSFDVETTTPLGFDPGNRREFHDSFGKLTGFAYVPQGNYTQRQALDGTGLASLVLQNLMASAQQRGDDLSPLGLAWDRYALVPGSETRDLLISAYGNYLTDFNRNRMFSDGLAVITRLEQVLGRSPKSDDLVRTFTHNLIVDRLNAKDFAGARAVVSGWTNRLDQTADSWNSTIFKSEALYRYQNSGWDAYQAWLSQGGASGATQADASSIEENIILLEMQRRAGSNRPADWETVLSFYAGLDPRWKSDTQVKNFADTMTYNLSVDYHNRFAALMNQGKKDQALSLLSEGLGRFPASQILLQDRARVGN